MVWRWWHKHLEFIWVLVLLAVPSGVAAATPITLGWANGPQSALPAQAGKTAGSPSAFEVASVRVVPANKRGLTSFSPSGATDFIARNVTLAVLVELAFGVEPMQISGKKLGSKEYYVAAKPWGNARLTREQLKPLLQQLLQQRFHLKYHRATKLRKGYGLVIAKRGPKLVPSKGASRYAYILPKGLRGRNISMPGLAGILTISLRCPVVDETGLKGSYDIKLDYAPLETTDSSLPSIFTAVEQGLGLKLKRQKVPVKMLVIDRVDKIPTPN